MFVRSAHLRPRRLRTPHLRTPTLSFSRANSTSSSLYDPDAEPREEESVDVCIVGGGPAGLSAAIRLKQLEAETGNEVRVVVLEKGAEVGSHILSGAVIEPSALDALLPDWRDAADHPLKQPVTSSTMRFFTQKHAIPIPHPPQMSGTGNYIVSLSRVAAWLGGVAEELGAEIYPGFAGARFLLTDGQVRGVVTHDAGVTRARTKSARFEPGVAFRAKATLLAEGAHGSLSKTAISMFNLREGKQAQTYGIGLKEVWRVEPEKHVPGKVVHTIGWPLQSNTYGGGWEYHMADGLVSIGLVVGLDYPNPYLEPYRELQRMKHHPHYRALLGGKSERLAYGARTLTEGGLQSLPKLDFPGGALIGCSAGVVNTAKIKGTHNAMRTGMLAAESAFAALYPEAKFTSTGAPGVTLTPAEQTTDDIISLSSYSTAFPQSPVYKDLYEVRNVRPSFGLLGHGTRWSQLGGILYSGMDTILRGNVPWTLKHHVPKDSGSPSASSPDALSTKPAKEFSPIAYPAYEAPLSTDLMSSVTLTGTNHSEGEPVHLRVMRGVGPSPDSAETASRRRSHVHTNHGEYAGLLQRACPAGVYEYVPDDGRHVVPGNDANEDEGAEGTKLVINSQNCIHCKLCDIKVPTQDITWTTPEGGGGPKYTLT